MKVFKAIIEVTLYYDYDSEPEQDMKEFFQDKVNMLKIQNQFDEVRVKDSWTKIGQR